MAFNWIRFYQSFPFSFYRSGNRIWSRIEKKKLEQKKRNRNVSQFPEKIRHSIHFIQVMRLGVWITKFQLDDERFEIHFVCIRASGCMYENENIEYSVDVSLLLMREKNYAQPYRVNTVMVKNSTKRNSRSVRWGKKETYVRDNYRFSTEVCYSSQHPSAGSPTFFSNSTFSQILCDAFHWVSHVFCAILMSRQFVSLAFGTYGVRSSV